MAYGDDHHPDLAHPLVQQTRLLGPPMSKEERKEMTKMLEKLSDVKDTNPKDAVGIKKAPISTVSGPVVAEMGLAMLEGARKYGRHNYRVAGVRASVYRDAAWRHLNKWWEGEDVDPDSGVCHIVKAMASLMVLRDAMIFDMWTDDRPPALPDSEKFWKGLDDQAAEVIRKYPNAVDPFTQAGIIDTTSINNGLIGGQSNEESS